MTAIIMFIFQKNEKYYYVIVTFIILKTSLSVILTNQSILTFNIIVM